MADLAPALQPLARECLALAAKSRSLKRQMDIEFALAHEQWLSSLTDYRTKFEQKLLSMPTKSESDAEAISDTIAEAAVWFDSMYAKERTLLIPTGDAFGASIDTCRAACMRLKEQGLKLGVVCPIELLDCADIDPDTGNGHDFSTWVLVSQIHMQGSLETCCSCMYIIQSITYGINKPRCHCLECYMGSIRQVPAILFSIGC